MLRGLLGFGKDDGRPPLPKGKIEVICPSCGTVQYEPRLVVSTFCKKCGEHLRIEKKRAVASAPLDPARKPVLQPQHPSSGTEPAADQAPPRTALPPSRQTGALLAQSGLKAIIAPPATEAAASQPAPKTQPIEPAAPADVFEAGDIGFGEMLAASGEAKSETVPEAGDESDDKQAAIPRSNSPLPTAPPPPASPSTLQRMKDQGYYKQQYFKDAECFDCHHHFKVGRSSRSTNCPQCGAYISLEDVEINMDSTQPVKTRGDVIIRKRGHLSASSVQCRDLKCYGIYEANAHCTGDAIYRTSGSIVGEVRCHRLVVEKGSDITFMNPLYADEVEIHAKITGTIFCKGAVLISSYGAVNGDVTARSVSIEPGGELNGAMNIIRADSLFFAPTTRPAAS